jgi:class I fructose-bisphosphate aldolase/fructose-bisphosphate aldolase/2-amino-3,7-dideoxy-D-threo-hept-6-ulosonate synthase
MCIGRNVFQHPDKSRALRLLHEAVCGTGAADLPERRLREV